MIFPTKDFLAGGAVSNMLMKYVWEDKYPINDLDIFVEGVNKTLGSEPTTPIVTGKHNRQINP